DLLRLVAFFVIGSGVVETVVVVVPGRVDGAGLHQFGELRGRGKDLVFCPHHRHVGRVGVDVVAEEKEKVGLVGEDGREDGRVLRSLEAEAEENTAEGGDLFTTYRAHGDDHENERNPFQEKDVFHHPIK